MSAPDAFCARLEMRCTHAPPHEVRVAVPASEVEQLLLQAPWKQARKNVGRHPETD